jgi:8-oxo-dGTP pyrophosphatase MutT (NUDIX family)
MPLPVPLRRLIYRIGYRVLQVFWLVMHPAVSGAKCVATHDGRVLLVRHTYGNRAWDLPGGTMRRGESPARTAQREFAEEIGVDVEPWTDLGDLIMGIGASLHTLHCFHADLPTPDVELDLGELQTSGWFSPADLPSDLSPFVVPIIARVSDRFRVRRQ